MPPPDPTFSEAYGLDISKATPKQRSVAVSSMLHLARELGIEVRHRSQGWTTIFEGEQKNWWPADVNLLADWIEDVARERIPAGER